MNKTIIKVPSNIDYISEWVDFEQQIPHGQVIINKKYPGCGLTTWALYNKNVPIVLCVPRIYLAENKAQQLDQDNEPYFFFKPSTKTNPQKRKEENQQNFDKLRTYLFSCHAKAPKILVTYDSLPTIYLTIINSGIDFLYVVDEHQATFQDYSLKPEVIERVSSLLYSLNRVWYISATPILEKYLDCMEHLNTLPYVELEWSKDKVIEVHADYREIMISTADEISKIIQAYKQNGVFDTMTENGVCYQSTEAVFYINNVKDIVKIIKENGLLPSEVNILVANDSKNKKEIQKLGKGYGFGKIPLRGMTHKPYTFCSKCSYFGIDFYSTSASTFIFADSNIKSMCTDLSLDLLQIIGRQRLSENHFSKKCYIFVKKTQGEIEDETVFKSKQRSRWMTSASICNDWNGLSQQSLSATIVNHEICPYGVIYQDPLNGSYIAKNCINALIAERHAWEMRNRIYTNHETVQSIIIRNGLEIIQNQNLPPLLQLFVEEFLRLKSDEDRMKHYADFFDCHPNLLQTINSIPPKFYNFYRTYGTDMLRSFNYNMEVLSEKYQVTKEHAALRQELPLYFHVGEKYSKEFIKTKLADIYAKLNICRNAKATDLSDFYNIREVKMTENGKRKNCFLITDIV